MLRIFEYFRGIPADFFKMSEPAQCCIPLLFVLGYFCAPFGRLPLPFANSRLMLVPLLFRLEEPQSGKTLRYREVGIFGGPRGLFIEANGLVEQLAYFWTGNRPMRADDPVPGLFDGAVSPVVCHHRAPPDLDFH